MGIAAGLILAMGAFLWRATRPEEFPLLRFSADLGPDAITIFRLAAAISPDGNRIAFLVQPGGTNKLAARLMDQSTATVLSGTENATDATFSPDGKWIAFSTADQKLKKISVNGGAAVTLCDAPTFRGASWGEDGYIYAALGFPGSAGISRVPEGGGNPELLERIGELKEHGHLHRWPQILPGAKAVLFTASAPESSARWEDATMEVLSLRTGQYKTVQRGGHYGRYLPSGHLLYVHEGTLFAAPFDLARLEVRGTPAPIEQDVAASASAGEARLDFSTGPNGHGTLVYGKADALIDLAPAVWLDATGAGKPLLSSPQSTLLTPRFSPDGRRVAGRRDGDIWVYDLQRGSPLRLSFAPSALNSNPVWTPDGKHIAFSPTLGGIWWVRSDGSSQPQLLYGPQNSSALAWSFSPDGKRLAFHQPGKNRDIFTLPLDLTDPDHPKAGQPEVFLDTPGVDLDPMFSPDGRWMAYSSNESGNYVVSVRPFPPRPNGGKWQVSSTPGARFPIWSRTAKELFYMDGTRHIMVVPYSVSGETFSPGTARQWSSAALMAGNVSPYDLAPDGKRFVALAGTDNSGRDEKVNVHVTFLVNFFDELKRRMP